MPSAIAFAIERVGNLISSSMIRLQHSVCRFDTAEVQIAWNLQ